jgi:hypothetical protein
MHSELFKLCIEFASGPGFPSPEGPHPLPGNWSNDCDGLDHARAEVIEPDKGQPIHIASQFVRDEVFHRNSRGSVDSELGDVKTKPVLHDWTLPPELWAVFPTGRRASVKAGAIASFIKEQLPNGINGSVIHHRHSVWE